MGMFAARFGSEYQLELAKTVVYNLFLPAGFNVYDLPLQPGRCEALYHSAQSLDPTPYSHTQRGYCPRKS